MLVWKLGLHTKTESKSMDLSHWTDPELIGSTAGPAFMPTPELDDDLMDIVENGVMWCFLKGSDYFGSFMACERFVERQEAEI